MSAQATGRAGQLPEIDPGLSQEWLDSRDEVVDTHGVNTARAHPGPAAPAGRGAGCRAAIARYGIEADAVEPRRG